MAKNTKQSYESNPFKVIFNGFDRLFKVNQNMAIILLIISVLGSIGQIFNYTPASTTTSGEGQLSSFVVGLIVAAVAVIMILAIFFGTMVNGFISYVGYKTSKNEETNFGESIKAVWDKFWVILWIQVVVFFKVLGGLLLFIIPGIRALLRYDMVLYPVFDKNTSAKEAIKQSKAITKNHLIEVFGMSFASGIIPFIGQTMHVGGQSIMYPQLRDLHSSGAEKPKVHWLNYLGFFVVFGLILLILLTVALILVATSKIAP